MQKVKMGTVKKAGTRKIRKAKKIKGGSRKLTRRGIPEDEIRSRVNYSLAVLGMSFVHRGSGRFLAITPKRDRLSFNRTSKHA